MESYRGFVSRQSPVGVTSTGMLIPRASPRLSIEFGSSVGPSICALRPGSNTSRLQATCASRSRPTITTSARPRRRTAHRHRDSQKDPIIDKRARETINSSSCFLRSRRRISTVSSNTRRHIQEPLKGAISPPFHTPLTDSVRHPQSLGIPLHPLPRQSVKTLEFSAACC